MDDVAWGINESRRRREVIKEVLTRGKGALESSAPSRDGATLGLRPKKRFTVGVAASVKLGKVKAIKNVAKSEEGADGSKKDQVEDKVKRMEAELKRCNVLMHSFARETVDWAQKMKHLMTSLYTWSDPFGRVIGISPDSESEAFDAFKMVLRYQIIPVCADLEKVVLARLLPQLSLLVDSMEDPLKLLGAMHTLEPLHYGLLNRGVSKSGPPALLLEASQSYFALREQLFAELPHYLVLLHKGIGAVIAEVYSLQTTFYNDTCTHWNELWDALRVEEDSSVSNSPETVRIWRERFSPIDEALSGLGILKRPKISVPSINVTPLSPDSSISSAPEAVWIADESLSDFEILDIPSPVAESTKMPTTSGGAQSSSYRTSTSAKQEYRSKMQDDILDDRNVGRSQYRMSLQNDDQTYTGFNRRSCSTGDAWSFDHVHSIADDTQSAYSDL